MTTTRWGWFLAGLIAAIAGAPAQATTPTVAAGADHSLAVNRDGQVLAWGNDESGQLGLDRQILSAVPRQVTNLDVGLVADSGSLAAGTAHNLVLTQRGRVMAWGGNKWYTQLGDGGGPDRSRPLPVAGLSGVVAVAASEDHSAALAADGRVWGWGANSDCQVGDGTISEGVVIPVPIPDLTEVTALAAGWFHTVALQEDGSVRTWGLNSNGQLGDETAFNRCTPTLVKGIGPVAAIAAGDGHTLALDTDGNVWAWGNNDQGQIGDGTTTDRLVPTRVSGLGQVRSLAAGDHFSLALMEDGSLWGWGQNFGEVLGAAAGDRRTIPIRIAGVNQLVAISAGTRHILALRQGGVVWSWGDNEYGELGDGTRNSRSEPSPVPGLSGITGIAAGWNHSLARSADGQVWVWGRNSRGQLGDRVPITRPTPMVVPLDEEIADVAGGGGYSLALGADGRVWAWGTNDGGQLGNGTTVERSDPVQVQGITQAQAIAAGFEHSFAIHSNGVLLAWGANGKGQLGDGTKVSRATPVAVLGEVTAVAGGDCHSLAARTNGTLWSWGCDQRGQLGSGNLLDRAAPARVYISGNVTAVSAGLNHSMALTDDGGVWTWGANDRGQLGDGTAVDGSFRSRPFKVPGLSGVVAVRAGYEHSLALTGDGKLWAWGNNWYGQIGTEGDVLRPRQIAGIDPVSAMAGGYYHSLGLKQDGTLWAWGDNDEGELGIGVYEATYTPQLVTNETVTGVLDLDDATPNQIPQNAVPRVILAARKEGGLHSLALGASVYIGETDLGAVAAAALDWAVELPVRSGGDYKLFVGAIVPQNDVIPSGIYMLPADRVWTFYTGGALPEYLSNISSAQASHVDVAILDGLDVSALGGSQILVGWGSSDQEMLQAQRYRSIYRVPKPDEPAQ